MIAGLGIYAQIRRREFEHRERLAMIEKGMAPPGPMSPPGTAQGTAGSAPLNPFDRDIGESHEDRALSMRRGGFVLIAIGVGVGFLIWVTAHEPDAAVGVGGFLLILGAAIYASSYFGRPRAARPRPPGGGGQG